MLEVILGRVSPDCQAIGPPDSTHGSGRILATVNLASPTTVVGLGVAGDGNPEHRDERLCSIISDRGITDGHVDDLVDSTSNRADTGALTRSTDRRTAATIWLDSSQGRPHLHFAVTPDRWRSKKQPHPREARMSASRSRAAGPARRRTPATRFLAIPGCSRARRADRDSSARELPGHGRASYAGAGAAKPGHRGRDGRGATVTSGVSSGGGPSSKPMRSAIPSYGARTFTSLSK